MKTLIRYMPLINFTLIVIIFIIFIYYNTTTFNLTKIASILGLVVTVIAFLVACYFIAIAKSVYSKISEIERVKSDIDRVSNEFSITLNKVNTKKTEIFGILMDMVKMMDDFISEQIYFIDHGRFPATSPDHFRALIEKKRNTLIRKRSIMALKYTSMDTKRRCALITEIVAVAKDEDIEKLQNFLSIGEEENEEIIDTINMVLSTLTTNSNVS